MSPPANTTYCGSLALQDNYTKDVSEMLMFLQASKITNQPKILITYGSIEPENYYDVMSNIITGALYNQALVVINISHR